MGKLDLRSNAQKGMATLSMEVCQLSISRRKDTVFDAAGVQDVSSC